MKGRWDFIRQRGRRKVFEVEVAHTGGRWGVASDPVDLGERLVRARMSAVVGD